MALIESQNANAKRFTKEISNENILYEFAKRILKSAKLVCSMCADNFSNLRKAFRNYLFITSLSYIFLKAP